VKAYTSETLTESFPECLSRGPGPASCTPFAITIDGERYAVISDGHAALAIRGLDVGGEEQRMLGSHLEREGQAHRVRFADLRAWVSTHGVLFEDLPERQCPECKGTQKIKCDECDGLGHVECNLGHDHDCEECIGGTVGCDECDEGRLPAGRVAREPPDQARHVQGILFGYGIDRRLLATALRLVEADYVDVYIKGATGGCMFLIVAEEWRAAVMSMSGPPNEVTGNAFPSEVKS
jgi:hypothetical protein